MLFIALALAGVLAAQTPQNVPSDPTAVDDVVVSARPLDRQISTFLDDVVVPDRNLRVARFNRNICVGAVNMRGEMGQYIVDRVSQIGMDIGLEPGDPGCAPNILIIASQDGAALAKGMVDARPRIFNPGGTGMTRTRAALARFQASDLGIRWWHVAMPVDSRTGQIAVRLPGEDAPTASGANSRLRSDIRNDINRAIIIVDFEKMAGMNATQVADFAAMVALSQVDLDSDFSGYDSILSLMSDRQFEGISEWDMAYLRALYSAELTGVSKNQQMGEIARLMEVRQIRPRERAKAAATPSDQS